ncbi:hypothetical protein [Altererythrobacter sp. MF3-039]|uniref:hypothetical protein n=1 Tax=Altererythrobacter sp. MF3-039 TaxID=3252901 RepID=UPI00390CC3A7
MRAVFGIIAVTTLMLAGCGEEKVDRSSDDDRTASGEVRGGTISDEMLPLDTIRSQSPPLRVDTRPAADGSSDSDTDSEADAEEAPAESESDVPAEAPADAD